MCDKRAELLFRRNWFGHHEWPINGLQEVLPVVLIVRLFCCQCCEVLDVEGVERKTEDRETSRLAVEELSCGHMCPSLRGGDE